MSSSLLRSAVPTLLALVLAGCATSTLAPVEDRKTPPPPIAITPAAPAAAPAPGARAAATEPTDSRPQSYTVKRGDTLFGIALDHGLDYRELAAWNSIENVNLIRVGQVLRLTAPGESTTIAAQAPGAPASGVVTAPLKAPPPIVAGGASTGAAAGESRAAVAAGARNTGTYKTQPKAVKEPYSDQALREMQRALAAAAAPSSPEPLTKPATPEAPVARAEPKPEARPEARSPATDDDGDERLEWGWPATGKVVAGFSETANLKGIDIAGKAGQPVLASAGGKVVYAGSGLRGYGKLIIIKHSKSYLSAYAHNRDILVKEGQQVTRGQKIAEMGSTDADQVKLHFEIRRQGRPIDPMKFLPPA